MDNTNMSDIFPVYIINSAWSLANIRTFLMVQFGALPEDIYHMRIIRKNGKETNSTLVCMNRKIYDDAVSQKYNARNGNVNFMINQFVLREYNYPDEGYSRNLYIPMSKDISINEVEDLIHELLKICINASLISITDYSIKIPLESRETGQHKGLVYVTFNKNINLDTITIIKTLLNDTYVLREITDTNCEKILIKCYWARNKTNNKERNNKSKRVIKKD